MQFAYPYALFALLLIPPLCFLYFRRQRCFAIFFPMQSRVIEKNSGFFELLVHLGFVLYLLALVCIIVALARPRFGKDRSTRTSEGLDIFLVIDTSESMSSQDMILDGKQVNRLDAVKEVVKEFIQKRWNDRIGLVIFGTEAFAQAPLTLDHAVLVDFLDETFIGMAGTRTAIGDAIGVASNRLHILDAPSKVMILLTDGANSAGSIDPEQAAKAAQSLGIKIYTIAVAGEGRASMFHGLAQMLAPVAHVDEKLLKNIAALTSGQYFRAENTTDLQQIYTTIDELETQEAEEAVFLLFEERFFPYALAALVLWLCMHLWSVFWGGRVLA